MRDARARKLAADHRAVDEMGRKWDALRVLVNAAIAKEREACAVQCNVDAQYFEGKGEADKAAACRMDEEMIRVRGDSPQ